MECIPSTSGTAGFTHRFEKPETNDDGLYYNCRAEIFLALREITYSWVLNKWRMLSPSLEIRSQLIVVYYKRPGALKYVELCNTEVIFGKSSLQFATPVILNFDYHDMASAHLRFEFFQWEGIYRNLNSYFQRDPKRPGMIPWSSTEVTLDKILKAGPKGISLMLDLKFETSCINEKLKKEIQMQCAGVIPGFLFLRAEIYHPANCGYLIRFEVMKDKKLSSKYFVEFSKINQDDDYNVTYPYTLVYNSIANTENIPVYFPEERLANQNFDRMLKFEVFKHKSYNKKGFVLTQFRDILQSKMLILGVENSTKMLHVTLTMFQIVPTHPLSFYLECGWKIVPIYVMDLSDSTLKSIQSKCYQDPDGHIECKDPIEEAIEISLQSILQLATPQSIFCWSNQRGTFEVTPVLDFTWDSILNLYKEASMSSKLANDLHLPTSKGQMEMEMKQTWPRVAGSSMPIRATRMATILQNMLALVKAQTFDTSAITQGCPTYFSLIVYTDGQLIDFDQSVEVLKSLSQEPISITFVGVGRRDFGELERLEDAWKFYTEAVAYRKFVNLIHFRSLMEWNSAINYYRYISSPSDLFRKELLTPLRDQAIEYMRRCRVPAPSFARS